jgi:formylglycine-generating enzyme required for sulfatase activity
MKSYLFLPLAAASFMFQLSATAADFAPVVYDTPREAFGMADFDGDGKTDCVILDKETGKYRLGYLGADGMLSWVDCRPSGIKALSGLGIGKLFKDKPDSLAFAAADANQLSFVEASGPTTPPKPTVLSFSAALGPSLVVPVKIGGAGQTPLADLFVGSIYNSPDANLGTLLRNDGTSFPKIDEVTLAGVAAHGNHFPLKPGQPDLLCYLVTEEKADSFHADDLASGKPVAVASVAGLPLNSDYAFGDFRKAGCNDLLLYKPGQKNLWFRPVEDAGGKLAFGKGSDFELADPVRRVVALPQKSGLKLLVIHGEGEKAGIYTFDGSKAPLLAQTIYASNVAYTCAAPLPEGFVLFGQTAGQKFSNKYYTYKAAGDAYSPGPYGSLPSLADNDNITIPDIHERIAKIGAVASATDMKPYTNAIPGTRVTYAMLPIPGGEYTMGSPDAEADRKPDEGPQHKVRIEPFWMQQCEITWNEYELFMYPDEERRTRAAEPTDPAGDKLADAVTHPSKPYVEMSFGMGKDGYPAIAMTQHAANKYCQWLSAKTGHFYRLPTEAEWEYACRAGTTTTYFFGDDASKLGDYAWYEQNSDFKYQKVGKKKPNPWGLYDMTGNVVEWVLDQYDPDYYKQCASTSPALEPWNKATKPYPLAVRGGSWDDEGKMCRSAARRGSERAWKMQDPQLPKSIWYFSDAQWVGFRIVRPLKVPPAEQMQKYWSSGVERD